MKCRKCEKSINPDSRFCRHCGARIHKPPAEPKEAAPRPRPRPKPEAASATEDRQDIYHDPRHEKSIWRGRPAWRAFYGAWLIWALASAAFLAPAYKFAGNESLLVSVIWLIVAGVAVTLIIREALTVLGHSYQLTSQRLFVHRGILTRVTDQLELLRIDDVRLVQGVIDRVVDTGNLEIFSSDETDENISLEWIPEPVRVAEAVRLHARVARSKGALAVEHL